MKKNIKYIIPMVLAPVALVSCQDFLNLESKVEITGHYLTTADGIQREAASLYYFERQSVTHDDAKVYCAHMLDSQTDIVFFRTSTAANIFRCLLTSEDSVVESFWEHFYKIIGKANEVIANAEEYGLDDPAVKTAWGEAKFFRGRSYFELWKRFERLYLNTLPTTIDNLDRDYSPSEKEAIFQVVKQDLDDAIEALSWELPAGGEGLQYGRVTKAVAKHVRAQVAMWEDDWQTVIDHCEDIFTKSNGLYGMEAKLEDVFLQGENLRSKEVLWALQFSKNLGGGGSGVPLDGHVVSKITTSQYRKISGCIPSTDQGGYGWGRIFPNQYLLDLYEETDTRYNTMFKHEYYYNDPDFDYSNKDFAYGDVIKPETPDGDYANALHPMSKKFFDQWTNADLPERASSFRDLILYRMGETSLMLCEAYFHQANGNSSSNYDANKGFVCSDANALYYYNKTYERAGNTAKTSITIDDIVDEYARECNFEGVRWPMLKRMGILAERVKAYSGETTAEVPYLDTNYDEARVNFVEGKHERWPIPNNQILLMGGHAVFPQNEEWD